MEEARKTEKGQGAGQKTLVLFALPHPSCGLEPSLLTAQHHTQSCKHLSDLALLLGGRSDHQKEQASSLKDLQLKTGC